MFNKKQKRFETNYEQGFQMGALTVVVDTETGVNYLVTLGNGPSGITPLLDSQGKVVITLVEKK